MAMSRQWIAQGLQLEWEREEQLRLASERRLHKAAVVKEKGPGLMRRLVAEVAGVVDEYRQIARPGADRVEFSELPGDGFYVAKVGFPRVILECRPGYESQTVNCNMTRRDDHESAAQEFVFSLGIEVDDSDNLALDHDTHAFHTVDQVVEFLLKPVLFPALNQVSDSRNAASE